MCGLRGKYQNDVLHGKMNVAPLNDCCKFPASFKISICRNICQ